MSRARDLALRARGLLDVLDAVDRDVAPTRAQKPVVDLDAPLRAFVDASAREHDANILSLSLARREREVAALREALRRAEDERDAALSESRDAALERDDATRRRDEAETRANAERDAAADACEALERVARDEDAWRAKSERWALKYREEREMRAEFERAAASTRAKEEKALEARHEARVLELMEKLETTELAMERERARTRELRSEETKDETETSRANARLEDALGAERERATRLERERDELRGKVRALYDANAQMKSMAERARAKHREELRRNGELSQRVVDLERRAEDARDDGFRAERALKSRVERALDDLQKSQSALILESKAKFELKAALEHARAELERAEAREARAVAALAAMEREKNALYADFLSKKSQKIED